jgi:sulfide:quinone oxidoreductase
MPPFNNPITAHRGDRPFNVVIAGGGVGAIEAMLCLHELGPERISTTIVAPNPEFVDVPMVVQEPFGRPLAKRYPLARIADDAGAELCVDSVAWLDSEFRVAHTIGGEEFRYDALLLAPGATVYPRYRYSVTLDPAHLDDQLHGLIQDVEGVGGGHVHALVFVVPDGSAWPLPIYELALMTAGRAMEMSAEVEITIVTPEPAPLAIFGPVVADHIGRVLETSGIRTFTSTRCAVHGPGLVALHPGTREIRADRVVALPQLFGPSIGGVPTNADGGFISTDGQGSVPGLERVWAVGDATDFPIKFGGIAAQQADVAAQSIAMLAGSGVEPERFRPELHAVLLTAERPLLLSAELDGGTVIHSQIFEVPAGSAPAKIAARYLTPYLAELDRAAIAR